MELFDAFHAAALRGVRVRILIDDLHALALGKVGGWFVRQLANQRVVARARRTLASGLEMRVHSSKHGRMMHLKCAGFASQVPYLIGGQANYTPNSFSGAWLETVVRVEGREVHEAFCVQFEDLWHASQPPDDAAWPIRVGRSALLEAVERTVFRF
jgi:phosphatidylserine/phosphatidylglycerophosphate/cardiolipin synthase-like enzyme